MSQRAEPFSTHRPWDDLTKQAYADQPLRGRYHYALDETCSPAEVQAWREWCKRHPKSLWPNHVLTYAARQAHTGGRRG